jgi:predicted small metal-binding protein
MSTRKEQAMRALDCSQGHDPIHFSAETDEELMEKVRTHAAEVHPELGEEALQGMFTQLVHDE